MDPEKLAAFVLITAATSVAPGPSMLFVMAQSIWRGRGPAAVALAGVQAGYLWWWFLAFAGLGALAKAWPFALHLLAFAGAVYLAWLGVMAFRSSAVSHEGPKPEKKVSAHAFRDGIFVAMSNPKALIYIVAIIPPFIDEARPLLGQIGLMALIGMAIDVALGAIYIAAGSRLSQAMSRGGTRAWVDRTVGTIFMAISAAILADLVLG
jgi:threonine/homoserine/homoserine lactone efflux protein